MEINSIELIKECGLGKTNEHSTAIVLAGLCLSFERLLL